MFPKTCTVQAIKMDRISAETLLQAKAAGFLGIQVACCAYNFPVVEFYNNMLHLVVTCSVLAPTEVSKMFPKACTI